MTDGAAAGAGRHPLRGQCLAPGRSVDAPRAGTFYARLFPDLPPLENEAGALHALGRADGACSGSELEPASKTAAGWPFFGQLVAHDITADRSPLDHLATDETANARTPRLDLECVYGGGPVGSPYLYDREDGAKMLLGQGGRDLPRNDQGTALLGDPRNDVHLFVNRLHHALLRAHNAVVDTLRAEGAPEASLFEEARALIVWHYQWVVIEDFLRTLVGEDMLAQVKGLAPTERLVTEPRISYEFADAAYRYGHSQVLQDYVLQEGGAPHAMFPDLLGFRLVPRENDLDWAMVFDLPGRRPAARAGRIDAHLPPALIRLPDAITGEVDDPDYRSLASRDLQRGRATALPSGEAVARALGAAPLTADHIALPGWKGETPLWVYVQREAAALHSGNRLGPVGGRIVAETLWAIVEGDGRSYAGRSGWTPVLPSHTGRFGLVDLLLLPERLSRATSTRRPRS